MTNLERLDHVLDQARDKAQHLENSQTADAIGDLIKAIDLLTEIVTDLQNNEKYMEIKTKLREITWLSAMPNVGSFFNEIVDLTPNHGYGCGYVGVSTEHPWYGKHCDDIEADIHGGLTWSEDHVGDDPKDGYWWVGFDTAHYGDNMVNCDKQYCLDQIEKLKQQALDAIKK